MASTNNIFSSKEAHREWLKDQARAPLGFKTAVSEFEFVPAEVPKAAKMRLTLVTLEKPTRDFAAMFTRNAFPGAPVITGKKRLEGDGLGAILINNKISNVCAPGGVEIAERLCEGAGNLLGMSGELVLPSSTGVIGWGLPEKRMMEELPGLVKNLKEGSLLEAAEGIMTTDLFPKVRGADVCDGRLVGFAKGAGMIEPNLATMLVYLLTDIAVPRELLRECLKEAVGRSFNKMSIDGDMSTSDTVVLLSSGKLPFEKKMETEFRAALKQICCDLAEDVVRNGEGVHHVIRVELKGCQTEEQATLLGKAIVNAPLFKCAVAGNDPNVGRLIQALGKVAGTMTPATDVSKIRTEIGGVEIFANQKFQLNREKELKLVQHLKDAELYSSSTPTEGVFTPPVDFPKHERCVEVLVDLNLGNQSATVIGGDLTHEYISENADYRS